MMADPRYHDAPGVGGPSDEETELYDCPACGRENEIGPLDRRFECWRCRSVCEVDRELDVVRLEIDNYDPEEPERHGPTLREQYVSAYNQFKGGR